MHAARGSIPRTVSTGHGSACLESEKVETGESKVGGHPQLHSIVCLSPAWGT